MQEIILYAVLALIVGAMLYSVLGKNVGQGPESAVDPQDFLDKFSKDDKPLPEPEPKFDGPAAQGLAAIAKADPNFTRAGFLDGATQAYGMILEAFADGDKDTLKDLLNDEVRQGYFDAIDAREEKGLSQTTDLARLISVEIVGASRTSKTGNIRVAYHAELATALTDKNGDVVDGDLDVLSRVKEIWSYDRTLGSKNPNWILSSVEPHDTLEGDIGGPDHSPDTE